MGCDSPISPESPTSLGYLTAPASPCVKEFSSACEVLLSTVTDKLPEKIASLEKENQKLFYELAEIKKQLIEKNSELEKNSRELKKSDPVSISVECVPESGKTDSENTSLLPNINEARCDRPRINQFVMDEIDNNANDAWFKIFYRQKQLSSLHVLLFLLTTYFITFLFTWLLFRCSTVATDNCEKDFMKKNYRKIGDDVVTKVFTDFYNDCPLTANYLADNYTCYPEIYQHVKDIVQESYERTRLIEITQKRYLLALNWVDTEPFIFNSDCNWIHYNEFNESVINVTVYNRNVFMPLVILGLEKDSIELMYKRIYNFCENLKVVRPDASVHILFISAYGSYPFHMPRNNSLFSTFNLYPVKTANETHFFFRNVAEAVKNTWPLFAKKLLSHWFFMFNF